MKKLKLFVMSVVAMFVAVIGVNAGTPDEDFRDCLSGEDDTCTLTGDIEPSSYFDVNRDVTIDLGGYTITRNSGNVIFYIEGNANVTFTGNGKVESKNEGSDAIVAKSNTSVVIENGTFKGARCGIIAENSTITVNGGTITGGNAGISVASGSNGNIVVNDGNISGNYGILAGEVDHKYTITINNGTITGEKQGIEIGGTDSTLDVKNGTISGNVESAIAIFGKNVVANIEGGTITSDNGFAISGNGSREGNINATINSTINISGGSLTSTTTAAIYHPQSGTLNITGGDITGKLGIVARSGNITIGEDAKITTTGDPSEKYQVGDAKEDGDYVRLDGGTGVVLDNTENYPGGKGTVKISGGEFNTTGASVLDYKNTEPTKNITVSGGEFSEEVPSEYLSENVTTTTDENGITYVGKESSITVESTTHGTVTADKETAVTGQTVTLTIKADNGYELGTLVVKDAAGKEIEVINNTFEMPDSNVTVTATFNKIHYVVSGGTTNEPTEEDVEIVVEDPAGDKEVTLSTETNEVLKESLTNTEDEDLKALLENEKVTVELKANDVKKEDVAKEEVEKFENVVKGATVAEYFDLDILVTAGEKTEYLTELSKPITLTIDLPELPEVAEGYVRTYYILREHNGVYEKLNATLKDGKLTFATDKFSRYAIAYVDEKVKNPNTGDNIVNSIAMSIISLVGLASCGLYLNKKQLQ